METREPKDKFLAKSLANAEELYKDHGADVAYDYLKRIIYFQLYGEFMEHKDKE